MNGHPRKPRIRAAPDPRSTGRAPAAATAIHPEVAGPRAPSASTAPARPCAPWAAAQAAARGPSPAHCRPRRRREAAWREPGRTFECRLSQSEAEDHRRSRTCWADAHMAAAGAGGSSERSAGQVGHLAHHRHEARRSGQGVIGFAMPPSAHETPWTPVAGGLPAGYPQIRVGYCGG